MSYNSRLQRREIRHQWRVAGIWILLTVLVITGLLVYGIPLFIKLVVWYGDYKSSGNPIVIEDMVPPAPPLVNLPYIATSSAVLKVDGRAEPGVTVKIFVNDEEVKSVVADADGRFMAGEVTLNKGYNLIFATAVDGAQNVSVESRRERVLYDNQAPELVVESPGQGSQFYGSAGREIEVTGKTDMDARVSVNGRSVIVNSDGSFAAYVTLDAGEQILEVRAVDEAGNESKKDVNVEYRL
jgi:hypothetical protein